MQSGRAKQEPCQHLACKLQKCLASGGYQISNCEHIIERLRECCTKHPESVNCAALPKTSQSESENRESSTDLPNSEPST
mmetsp:Transcript_30539/g.72716  ORF Transcript_30539/g.72716 Transcript_30539/m.72716 type:complete len:80 (-) Transcript_30539:1486-1725(-)